MSVESRLSKLEVKNKKCPRWFWVWRFKDMTDAECRDYSERMWRMKIKPDDEIHWIRVFEPRTGELAEALPLYNVEKNVYEDYKTGKTVSRAKAA